MPVNHDAHSYVYEQKYKVIELSKMDVLVCIYKIRSNQ